MGSVIEIFGQSGFANMGWGNWIMFVVAGILIFLAICHMLLLQQGL